MAELKIKKGGEDDDDDEVVDDDETGESIARERRGRNIRIYVAVVRNLVYSLLARIDVLYTPGDRTGAGLYVQLLLLIFFFLSLRYSERLFWYMMHKYKYIYIY